MNRLGRTVKSLRVAAGFKQGDFARQIGITQAYLSAMEAGKRVPSLDLVERIAMALNIPAGVLLSCCSSGDQAPGQYEEIYARLQNLQELFLQLLVRETVERETSSGQNG